MILPTLSKIPMLSNTTLQTIQNCQTLQQFLSSLYDSRDHFPWKSCSCASIFINFRCPALYYNFTGTWQIATLQGFSCTDQLLCNCIHHNMIQNQNHPKPPKTTIFQTHKISQPSSSSSLSSASVSHYTSLSVKTKQLRVSTSPSRTARWPCALSYSSLCQHTFYWCAYPTTSRHPPPVLLPGRTPSESLGWPR